MKGNSKWQVMPSVIAALFVAMAFVGCKPGVPHQYIQPDELEEILYDYHLADGMLASRPAGDKADQTVAYHAAVLKKHHVTQAEFDSSMVYYMRNAEVLHGIYEKLGERMQKEVRNLGGESSIVAGQYTAKGDTASIWNEPSFMVLSSKVPFNYRSFSIKVDTAFHAGDMLLLSFNSQFIFQDGMRDGNVVLAIVLKNDSVVSRSVRLSSDMPNVLQVSDDAFIGIKEVKGYFQLNTSPNSMTVSTMRLMFLENIQLLRMHRKKTEPNTQGLNPDSIQIKGGANAPVGQPLQPSPSNKPAVPANLPSSALRRP